MFCECSDRLCSAHEGRESCTNPLSFNLIRIDIEDNTGTDMCEDCAEDALNSGLFRIREALDYDCERHGKGIGPDCPICFDSDNKLKGRYVP